MTPDQTARLREVQEIALTIMGAAHAAGDKETEDFARRLLGITGDKLREWEAKKANE